MILLLASALAFECEVIDLDQVQRPPPPTSAPAHFAVFDAGSIIVARALGDDLMGGLSYGGLEQAVAEALADRDTTYDVVALTHSPSLPVVFTAGAFHLGYDNLGIEGTGAPHLYEPGFDLRAVLWMNDLTYWDTYGDDMVGWVFAHELGHHWLAYPHLALPGVEPDALLGRQRFHWSYFLSTTNSPMEGNHWVDHGDGTFTTDIDAPRVYSPLDLYMMGWLGPDEVPDTFLVVPDDPGELTRESAPAYLWDDPEAVTLSGTRVEITLDDILEVEGPRTPGPTESQRDFSIATVLVLGPREALTQDMLVQLISNQARWAEGFDLATGQRGTASFSLVEEGRSIPPKNVTKGWIVS